MTPVGRTTVASCGATESAPSPLNMTTVSALDTGGTAGKLYDTWVYDAATGHWRYTFRVSGADLDYFVWEEQPAEGLMSAWKWIDPQDGHYTILRYTHDGRDNTATVTNRKYPDETPETGDLLVAKAMSADSEGYDGKAFEFIITIGDETETVSLRPGEYRRYNGLTAGTHYAVKERLGREDEAPTPFVDREEIDGTDTVVYTIARGTVAANTQTRVTATNRIRPKTGALSIKKTAEASEGVTDLDPDAAYAFTVKLWTGNAPRAAVTGTFGGALGAVRFNAADDGNGGAKGVATVRLRSGEVFDFRNLPAGTHYSVTEARCDHFVTKVGEVETDTATGTIVAGENVEAHFTNTKTENDDNGGFRRVKKLGECTETEDAFKFTVSFADLEPSATYAYRIVDAVAEDGGNEAAGESQGTGEAGEARAFVSDAGGKATVTLSLKAGQTADFSGSLSHLPEGATYTVTEGANGYVATYTVTGNKAVAQSSGGNTQANAPLRTARETVEKLEDATVVFTNTEPTQSATIIKKDAKAETALPGARLAVYRTGVLSSAEGVETAREEGMPVAAFTSGRQAQAVNLRSGSYVLRETVTPRGYLTARDIRFDIGSDGVLRYWSVDTTAEADVTTYVPAPGQEVKTGSAQAMVIEMMDEPISIAVKKVDATGERYPVVGALLQITDVEDGDRLHDLFWTTDVTGGHEIAGMLELDRVYRLEELTAPSGYRKAADIYFKLTVDGGNVTLSTSAAKNGVYEKADGLVLEMVDDTEFVFGKVWRGTEDPEEWPADRTMTVTLYRSATDSANDADAYATYTVTREDVKTNQTRIDALEGPAVPEALVYEGQHDRNYSFSIRGLPRYFRDRDGNLKQYTYYIAEDAAEGYQPPKYFLNGNENLAPKQPTGVEIHNDLATYALPSTGGPGTKGYTFTGVALISLALLLLLLRRRRDY